MKRVFSCVVAASLALSLLVGCGASSTASSAASSAASSEAASSVASSAAETAALPDGVYAAEFDTDSSMFHANEACDGKGTLTVENGQMTFHVSLASTHIVNLYLGKASDAADHEADWLQPTTDTVTYSDGTSEEVYGFDIPVTAVDTDFDLAILGTKGKWYDHVVSVRDAVEKAAEAETPADGTYTCDVTLEGGSGRAAGLRAGNRQTQNRGCPAYTGRFCGFRPANGIEPRGLSHLRTFQIAVFLDSRKPVRDYMAEPCPDHSVDFWRRFCQSALRAIIDPGSGGGKRGGAWHKHTGGSTPQHDRGTYSGWCERIPGWRNFISGTNRPSHCTLPHR